MVPVLIPALIPCHTLVHLYVGIYASQIIPVHIDVSYRHDHAKVAAMGTYESSKL